MKVLLAILGVTTITLTVRLLNIGFERIAKREIMPIVLYSFILLSPLVRGILYIVVFSTYFVFTQILFICIFDIKEMAEIEKS